MIAELFYPKELKDIIAELRAKDDLNEEALNRFDTYLLSSLKKVFIFFLCCFVFVSYQAPSYFFLWAFSTAIIFLIIAVLIRIECAGYVKKLSYLYNFGVFTNGVIVSYGTYKGGHGIVCCFKVDGEEKRSYIHNFRWGLERPSLHEKDPIFIAYDPVNSDRNAPFVLSLADIFYLRKEVPSV